MTVIKTNDHLNRLTGITTIPATDDTISYNYTLNDANQRTRVDLTDGSYWLYTYVNLGQLISGKKYWSNGTPVSGQQYG